MNQPISRFEIPNLRSLPPDIQEMIRDGIFAGKTYMDKEETAFMTSHAAYNQYLETMRSYEARRQDQGRQSAFAPEDLKEYARIDRDVVITGNNDRAQIWSADNWKAKTRQQLNPETISSLLETLGI